MKSTIFAAMFTFLLWGVPQFATGQPDFDGDGVEDTLDNCSHVINAQQDDTDRDDCGNLCDADYDQSGVVGWPDFGLFTQCYGLPVPVCCHRAFVTGCVVGLQDLNFLVANFAESPGPSGTTAGTTACP